MTIYQATIEFEEKALKTIEWFTENWDKEIGALGIGEFIDGILYIEKLCFPKQTVNGGHVHFKPADWGPVLAELTEEEIGKICFYWHKHPPGMPGASSGDETDTFAVFMPDDTERPFFAFMQTAKKTGKQTGYEYEARIDLRDPVWVTIKDVHIRTSSDVQIEEMCEKIIEEKVTTGYLSASDQTGASHGTDKKTEKPKVTYMWQNQQNVKKSITEEFEAAQKSLEDTLGDDIFSVKKENGAVIIRADASFTDWIVTEADDPDIRKLISNVKFDTSSPDKSVVTLQPKKKCLQELYKHFWDMSFDAAEQLEEDKEAIQTHGMAAMAGNRADLYRINDWYR